MTNTALSMEREEMKYVGCAEKVTVTEVGRGRKEGEKQRV